MSLRRDMVILACAVSAGIHAALVPGHGLPFVAATGLLAVSVLVLTLRPASLLALAAAATVLAGLLGSYALAVTTGLPFLHPQPEPIDGLALATKAIEAVGLAAALVLLPRPKGHLTWIAHTRRAPSRSA
ncbi:MAG TPA: hypothetical protein VFY02_12810 [Gaiellaceae bacterium]|nr:hypothetical protein [Gaiellaceae bacterium]